MAGQVVGWMAAFPAANELQSVKRPQGQRLAHKLTKSTMSRPRMWLLGSKCAELELKPKREEGLEPR